MLAIGGQAPKAVRSVECYSFKEDRWTHLSDMPVRRCRCGVAVVQVNTARTTVNGVAKAFKIVTY